VCGNRVREAGEECDDGNDNNFDGCRNNCRRPACGDRIVDPNEDCDDGNTINNDACPNDCTIEVCGDRVVDAGEECDDGNDNHFDGCRNNCRLPFCGDRIVDPDEDCDDGDGIDTNACPNDCTIEVCGDGVVDAGEECDDGNDDDADGCRNDCLLPSCGDGVTDAGEECDDGNTDNYDRCRNNCQRPYCGDLIVDGGEDCDDGDGIDDNACPNDCTLEVCGDGVVDAGEQCDDGNANDYDGCRNTCQLPYCGDLIVDAGESCDDGNADDDDECRNNCTTPTCGDGLPDSDEECDDGNLDNDDGCRNNCTEPACGDGVLDLGEECDDGNNGDDDGCRNNCTVPMCGDAVVDPDEECDDGNEEGGDGCSSDCFVEAQCLLDIEQTCAVPAAPTSANQCLGKVVSMKLRYLGEGCLGTTNPQEGKATCSGGADGAEPVHVLVSDKKGKKTFANVSGVLIGDLIAVDAAFADSDKLDSETFITVDGGLEVLAVHTSCSKPLSAGDQFGSFRVVELTTTEGGTTSIQEQGVGGDTECSISVDPVGTECPGKLTTFSLRYMGGGCANTSQDQSGKLVCAGDTADASPVRIIVRDRSDGGAILLDESGVGLGTIVTATAANGGKDKFPSNTFVEIRGEGGALLERLTIHTSCSKPLALGDRFGALTVTGMGGEEGEVVSLSSPITYSYVVSNPSLEAAVVDVFDSEFGVIATGLVIEAGGQRVLTVSAEISADTITVATVSGVTVSGGLCAGDTATSTVTVDAAAQGGLSCEDGKPAQLVFEYTGESCAATTNAQEGKATCTGNPNGAAPVQIAAGSPQDVMVSNGGSLAVGDIFTITAMGDRLKSETVLEIRQHGALLQALAIHTSCSKPLVVGDQFGSLRLILFVPEG
jgi:cysteine-rich repeat protein